jgi:glycosyltransferase involved in cell wall biosynthesis
MDQIVAECGLSVKPRDEKALAAAIESLLTNEDLYLRLVEGCQKKAEQFDSEQNLEKLYGSIRACQ